MPYSRLFYHFIWATKRRLPLIDATNHTIIYDTIVKKVEKVNGIVHALNGMEDHLHLVATIPPTLAISKFIGQIKGSSSFAASKLTGNEFEWQAEYGVLTVSESHLPTVINYVKLQQQQHRYKT